MVSSVIHHQEDQVSLDSTMGAGVELLDIMCVGNVDVEHLKDFQ